MWELNSLWGVHDTGITNWWTWSLHIVSHYKSISKACQIKLLSHQKTHIPYAFKLCLSDAVVLQQTTDAHEGQSDIVAKDELCIKYYSCTYLMSNVNMNGVTCAIVSSTKHFLQGIDDVISNHFPVHWYGNIMARYSLLLTEFIDGILALLWLANTSTLRPY